MKKYLFVALAVVGANAFGTSAQAADSCPNLFLTNASGSPRVVQGGNVGFVATGIVAIDIYLDGSYNHSIQDVANPPGLFTSSGGVFGLANGAHTLRNGVEACTINFTVVPVPINPTMTQGWTYWIDGSDINATVTHIFGFQRGSFGAMSPPTTSNNKTYESLSDMQVCTYFGCNVTSGLSISGWTSDPGKAWLTSVSAHGNTKTGATSYYSYSNGVATWSWGGQSFGFGGGGTTLITMSHN